MCFSTLTFAAGLPCQKSLIGFLEALVKIVMIVLNWNVSAFKVLLVTFSLHPAVFFQLSLKHQEDPDAASEQKQTQKKSNSEENPRLLLWAWPEEPPPPPGPEPQWCHLFTYISCCMEKLEEMGMVIQCEAYRQG